MLRDAVEGQARDSEWEGIRSQRTEGEIVHTARPGGAGALGGQLLLGTEEEMEDIPTTCVSVLPDGAGWFDSPGVGRLGLKR